jgi:hypothetical protein
VKNPVSGANMRVRTDVRRPKMMYDYGTFRPTLTETVPSAYIIPDTPETAVAVAKLRAHGIVLTPARGNYNVEKFQIDSTRVANQSEGHRERTTFGKWVAAGNVTVPAGLMVSMKQPLARLAFVLLEPRSDDGLTNWNFLDSAIEGRKEHPIMRVR